MFSVIAHLTSLAFVLWTAYCIYLYVECREGFLENHHIAVVWLTLAALTGLFFLAK